MLITYELTATETCEERFKTCTGLNLKPGPGSGSRTEARVRPGRARKSQGPTHAGLWGRCQRWEVAGTSKCMRAVWTAKMSRAGAGAHINKCIKVQFLVSALLVSFSLISRYGGPIKENVCGHGHKSRNVVALHYAAQTCTVLKV